MIGCGLERGFEGLEKFLRSSHSKQKVRRLREADGPKEVPVCMTVTFFYTNKVR